MQLQRSLIGALGIGMMTAGITVSGPALANFVTQYRFNPASNTFQVETSKDVIPKAMLLQNPTRVVLDLPGIRIQNPRTEPQTSGRLKEIRLGQFEPGTARVVLEFQPGYTPKAEDFNVRGVSYRNWVLEIPR